MTPGLSSPLSQAPRRALQLPGHRPTQHGLHLGKGLELRLTDTWTGAPPSQRPSPSWCRADPDTGLSPAPCPQSPPPARALGSESSAHILPVTPFLCTPWGSWVSQQDCHPRASRIGGMSPHHGHWFSFETWNLLVSTSAFRLGQDAGMYTSYVAQRGQVTCTRSHSRTRKE